MIERRGTGASKWDGLPSRFGVEDAIPMWVADMDFASPPAVVEALTKRAQHGLYGYTLKPGEYDAAIAAWLQRRHGWQTDPAWFSFSPGVVSGLSLVTHTFTDPGDRIIIQPPVYYPFARVINGLGRQVVENPLRYADGRYTMDFEDLERKVAGGARMIILCSPHNPVGRVWTEDELRRLGEICIRGGVLVASDEIHSDLIFRGYRHTPFATLGTDFAAHSVTLIAPSKTFNLAGLRSSVVIAPNPDLHARYEATMASLALGGSNLFGALALTVAYRDGEEWLEQLLDYLQGNRDLLMQRLAERIPAIRTVPPEGTYLAWLDCKELGLEDKALDEFFLKKARIAPDEGHIFGQGGSGFQRLNLALPRSLLRTALDQLEAAVAEL